MRENQNKTIDLTSETFRLNEYNILQKILLKKYQTINLGFFKKLYTYSRTVNT